METQAAPYAQKAERLAEQALGDKACLKKDAAKIMARRANVNLTLPDGGTNGALLATYEGMVQSLLDFGLLEDAGDGRVRLAPADKRKALNEAGKNPEPDPFATSYHAGDRTIRIAVEDEYGHISELPWNTPETNAEIQRIHAIRVARHRESVLSQLGLTQDDVKALSS